MVLIEYNGDVKSYYILTYEKATSPKDDGRKTKGAKSNVISQPDTEHLLPLKFDVNKEEM